MSPQTPGIARLALALLLAIGIATSQLRAQPPAPAAATPPGQESSAAEADKQDKQDKPGEPDGEKDGERAQEADPKTAQLVKDRYIRVREEGGKPVSLETSIIRFVPEPGSPLAEQGVTVDLIGAVHIGERDYYERLNKRFTQYDAMLYELVAPEGTVVPKGGGPRGGNPISALQGGMKNLLELDFQLEKIDYTKRNFVHADMSPAEMRASMKERGESVLQMFFKMMGHGFAQQGKAGAPNDVELLMALFAKDRAQRLKQIMAAQIVDMEALNAALAGPDGSNTLIGERNRKALEVMSREIKAGKKKLAIFYGAGHLPDFERRMIAEHQLKPVGVEWLTAWNLK